MAGGEAFWDPLGVVTSIVAGDDITVDDSDPANPIVSVTPASRVWMPLSTVVGGVPELVWDANDSLIPTEVPI